MKPEELKILDLLCDMGIDVNGNRNLQPWKAYDIDEVNLVIKDLEAENERLKKENAKLRCLAMHGMIGYASCKMNIIAEKYKDDEMSNFAVPTSFTKWHKKKIEWTEAYRKAKAELKEEYK